MDARLEAVVTMGDPRMANSDIFTDMRGFRKPFMLQMLLGLILAFVIIQPVSAEERQFDDYASFAARHHEIAATLRRARERIALLDGQIREVSEQIKRTRPIHREAINRFLIAQYSAILLEQQPDPVTGLKGITTPELREIRKNLPELSRAALIAYESDQNFLRRLNRLKGEMAQSNRHFGEQAIAILENAFVNRKFLFPTYVEKVEIFDAYGTIYDASWSEPDERKNLVRNLGLALEVVTQHEEVLRGLQADLAVSHTKRLDVLRKYMERLDAFNSAAERQLAGDAALEILDVGSSMVGKGGP